MASNRGSGDHTREIGKHKARMDDDTLAKLLFSHSESSAASDEKAEELTPEELKEIQAFMDRDEEPSPIEEKVRAVQSAVGSGIPGKRSTRRAGRSTFPQRFILLLAALNAVFGGVAVGADKNTRREKSSGKANGKPNGKPNTAASDSPPPPPSSPSSVVNNAPGAQDSEAALFMKSGVLAYHVDLETESFVPSDPSGASPTEASKQEMLRLIRELHAQAASVPKPAEVKAAAPTFDLAAIAMDADNASRSALSVQSAATRFKQVANLEYMKALVQTHGEDKAKEIFSKQIQHFMNGGAIAVEKDAERWVDLVKNYLAAYGPGYVKAGDPRNAGWIGKIFLQLIDAGHFSKQNLFTREYFLGLKSDWMVLESFRWRMGSFVWLPKDQRYFFGQFVTRLLDLGDVAITPFADPEHKIIYMKSVEDGFGRALRERGEEVDYMKLLFARAFEDKWFEEPKGLKIGKVFRELSLSNKKIFLQALMMEDHSPLSKKTAETLLSNVVDYGENPAADMTLMQQAVDHLKTKCKATLRASSASLKRYCGTEKPAFLQVLTMVEGVVLSDDKGFAEIDPVALLLKTDFAKEAKGEGIEKFVKNAARLGMEPKDVARLQEIKDAEMHKQVTAAFAQHYPQHLGIKLEKLFAHGEFDAHLAQSDAPMDPSWRSDSRVVGRLKTLLETPPAHDDEMGWKALRVLLQNDVALPETFSVGDVIEWSIDPSSFKELCGQEILAKELQKNFDATLAAVCERVSKLSLNDTHVRVDSLIEKMIDPGVVSEEQAAKARCDVLKSLPRGVFNSPSRLIMLKAMRLIDERGIELLEKCGSPEFYETLRVELQKNAEKVVAEVTKNVPPQVVASSSTAMPDLGASASADSSSRSSSTMSGAGIGVGVVMLTVIIGAIYQHIQKLKKRVEELEREKKDSALEMQQVRAALDAKDQKIVEVSGAADAEIIQLQKKVEKAGTLFSLLQIMMLEESGDEKKRSDSKADPNLELVQKIQKFFIRSQKMEVSLEKLRPLMDVMEQTQRSIDDVVLVLRNIGGSEHISQVLLHSRADEEFKNFQRTLKEHESPFEAAAQNDDSLKADLFVAHFFHRARLEKWGLEKAALDVFVKMDVHHVMEPIKLEEYDENLLKAIEEWKCNRGESEWKMERHADVFVDLTDQQFSWLERLCGLVKAMPEKPSDLKTRNTLLNLYRPILGMDDSKAELVTEAQFRAPDFKDKEYNQVFDQMQKSIVSAVLELQDQCAAVMRYREREKARGADQRNMEHKHGAGSVTSAAAPAAKPGNVSSPFAPPPVAVAPSAVSAAEADHGRKRKKGKQEKHGSGFAAAASGSKEKHPSSAHSNS